MYKCGYIAEVSTTTGFDTTDKIKWHGAYINSLNLRASLKLTYKLFSDSCG